MAGLFGLGGLGELGFFAEGFPGVEEYDLALAFGEAVATQFSDGEERGEIAEGYGAALEVLGDLVGIDGADETDARVVWGGVDGFVHESTAFFEILEFLGSPEGFGRAQGVGGAEIDFGKLVVGVGVEAPLIALDDLVDGRGVGGVLTLLVPLLIISDRSRVSEAGDEDGEKENLENHLVVGLSILLGGLGAMDDGGEAEAVLALEKDAGEVGGEGVCDDDEGPRPWGPEGEGGDDEDLSPVGGFAAAGFGAEAFEELGIGRVEVLFGEAAEPWAGIGEELFPSTKAEDEIVGLTTFAGEFLEREAVGIKAGERHFSECPGDAEVGGGDADGV